MIEPSLDHGLSPYNDPNSALMQMMQLLGTARCAMFTLDHESQFIAVGATLETISGHSARGLIGQSFSQMVHEPWQEVVAAHFAQGTAFTIPEIALHTQDGRLCWVRLTSVPSTDNPPTRQCLVQDVTEQREYTNELLLRNRALDATTSGVWIADATLPHLPMIYINPGFERMTGYHLADAFGENFRLLSGPETDADAEAAIEEAIRRQREITITLRNYRKDGTAFWNELSVSPVFDERKRLTHYIGIFQNVTAQKNAEDELGHERNLLRTLLDGLPDTMFVMSETGVFLEVHIGEDSALDHSPHALINASIDEVQLPRRVKNAIEYHLARALETGQLQEFEYELHDKNYDARMIALNDAEVLTLVRDMTKLRHVLENLKILHQVDDELSDNLMLTYVCSMGLDALLRLSHAQTGFIALIEDADTWTVMNIVGSYRRRQIERALSDDRGSIARALADHQPMLIADGQRESGYAPLLADTLAQMILPVVSHQRLVGVVVLEAQQADRLDVDRFQFAKLLTDRLAAYLDSARLYQYSQDQLDEITGLYKKVQRLEQLKTDMIRIASHDLKNPLAGIMLSLQFLRADFTDMDATYSEYVDNIQNAAKKMQRIIQGILSLERIEQMAEDQSGEVFDLTQVVRQTLQEQRDALHRKRHTLRLKMTDEAVNILGDPIQLQEAFSNLVSNAIKYTPTSGRIDVIVQRQGEMTQVRVIDNGYGVPEAQQANLFTPFFRARTAETDRIEGSGLGLHLVKNIVERHSGIMIFESEYGKGSIFGFDLPTTDRDSAPPVTGSTVIG